MVEALKNDDEVIKEIPPSHIWDDIQSSIQDSAPIKKDNLVLLHKNKNKYKDKDRNLDFKKLAIASAAVFLIAFTSTYMIQTRLTDSGFELAALSDFKGSATAELDSRSLTIETDGLEPIEDSFYEVWLLELDETGEVSDLISVGNITSDGVFNLPSGTDIDKFSTVDISIEPNDGNETHSGNSVLRGVVV